MQAQYAREHHVYQLANFFVELGDVLDQLSTSADSLVLTADVNIRLERTSNPSIVKFYELLACYDLVQHDDGVTHDAGGTLNAVCTCHDLLTLTVDILNVSFSDHQLLCWMSQLRRPPPVYVSSACRYRRCSDLRLIFGYLMYVMLSPWNT